MELTVQTLRAQGWATLVLRPALLQCFTELIADANWFFDKPVNEKAELDIRSRTKGLGVTKHSTLAKWGHAPHRSPYIRCPARTDGPPESRAPCCSVEAR